MIMQLSLLASTCIHTGLMNVAENAESHLNSICILNRGHTDLIKRPIQHTIMHSLFHQIITHNGVNGYYFCGFHKSASKS